MGKADKQKRRKPGTGAVRRTPAGTFKAAYPKAGGTGHHIRTFDTRPDAERWLDDLVAQAAERYDVDQGRQMFRAWATTWLAGLEADEDAPKATSMARYRFVLGYATAHLGDMALADIMPAHVDAAMRAIKRDLSPRTSGQIGGLLTRIFEEAVRLRYLKHNPAPRPKRVRRRKRRGPAAHTREVRGLTPDEARRLLAHVRGTRHELAWHLMPALGLRLGELLGLRREAIDFDRATVTIDMQVTQLEGLAHVSTTKNETTRVLPIPRALLTPLRRLCAERDDYLFPGRTGAEMNPSTLEHLWRNTRYVGKQREKREGGIARDLGFDDNLTIHSLRHTTGQLLADGGTSEHFIAAILGHTPSTVTRHYAPPSVDALRPHLESAYARLVGEAAAGRMAG